MIHVNAVGRPTCQLKATDFAFLEEVMLGSRKLCSVALILMIIATATATNAKDAGDIVVRLRGIGVLTDTSGTTDLLGGDAVAADDHVPELDFTYFLHTQHRRRIDLGDDQAFC
ncbi:MAG: hypothetical protein VCE75_12205 [Alphaproteobacteria bacterium]